MIQYTGSSPSSKDPREFGRSNCSQHQPPGTLEASTSEEEGGVDPLQIRTQAVVATILGSPQRKFY
jgi:hypothetical protein